MEEQKIVEEFIENHDMEADPSFRIIDLLSEIGEVASDAAKTSHYGRKTENLKVKEEEIGDAIFSMLALSSSLDIDAGSALETAMDKYRERVAEKGHPGSD